MKFCSGGMLAATRVKMSDSEKRVNKNTSDIPPIKRIRACLHGVGDPGLVGLVSFVFALWGTQNKRNLPH